MALHTIFNVNPPAFFSGSTVFLVKRRHVPSKFKMEILNVDKEGINVLQIPNGASSHPDSFSFSKENATTTGSFLTLGDDAIEFSPPQNAPAEPEGSDSSKDKDGAANSFYHHTNLSERYTWSWKDFRGKKHKAFFSVARTQSGGQSPTDDKNQAGNYYSIHPDIADTVNKLMVYKANTDDVCAILDDWRDSSLHLLNLLRELKKMEEWKLAQDVFDWSKLQYWYRPKMVAYGTMVATAAREGNVKRVEDLFEDMQAEGLVPCGYIYGGCIDALARSQHYGAAVDLLFRRHDARDPDVLSYFKILLDESIGNADLHFVTTLIARIEASEVKLDTETFEILMRGFRSRNLPALIEDTFRWMQRSGIEPSATCHSLRMSALARLGKFQAMEGALETLQNSGLVSKTKLAIVQIEAAVRAGELDAALELFSRIETRAKKASPYLFSLLLSACSKKLRVDDALTLLDEMRSISSKRSLVIYNMVLAACGRAKQTGRMESILQDLKDEGFKPDSCTYTTLIQFCRGTPNGAHRAIHLFAEMKHSGIKVDGVVYFMYLDLLCKEGLMDEAESVFYEMKENRIEIKTRVFAVLALGWVVAGNFDKALWHIKEGSVFEDKTIWDLVELGFKERRTNQLKELLVLIEHMNPDFLSRLRFQILRWKAVYEWRTESEEENEDPVGVDTGASVQESVLESDVFIQNENVGIIPPNYLVQDFPFKTGDPSDGAVINRDEGNGLGTVGDVNDTPKSAVVAEPELGHEPRVAAQQVTLQQGQMENNPIATVSMNSTSIKVLKLQRPFVPKTNIPESPKNAAWINPKLINARTRPKVESVTQCSLPEVTESTEFDLSKLGWKRIPSSRTSETTIKNESSGIHSDALKGTDSTLGVSGPQPTDMNSRSKDTIPLNYCGHLDAASENGFLKEDEKSLSAKRVPVTSHAIVATASAPVAPLDGNEVAVDKMDSNGRGLSGKNLSTETHNSLSASYQSNSTNDGHISASVSSTETDVKKSDRKVLSSAIGSEDKFTETSVGVTASSNQYLNLIDNIPGIEEMDPIPTFDSVYSLSSSPSPSGSHSLDDDDAFAASGPSIALSGFEKSPKKEVLLHLMKHHCGEGRAFSSPASILKSLNQLNLSHSMHVTTTEWMAQICCQYFNDRDKIIFAAGLLRLLNSDGHDPSVQSCCSVIRSMVKNNMCDVAKSFLQEMGRSNWLHVRHAYHSYISLHLKSGNFASAKNALTLMREDGLQLSVSDFAPLISWLTSKEENEGDDYGTKDLLFLLDEVEEEGIALDRDSMLCVFTYFVSNQLHLKAVTWLRKFIGRFPEDLPDESILMDLFNGLFASRMWRSSLDIFTLLHSSGRTHTLEGYTVMLKTLIRCNQPKLAVELSAQMEHFNIEPNDEVLAILRASYKRLGMEEEWRLMNDALS